MDFLSFVWLGIAIVALLLEAGTAALVSIWFVPSALLAMVLSFFKIPFGFQFAAFAVCSAILIIFMKRIFKKTLGIKPVATNADAVIGEEAVVLLDIDNLAGKGQVKVKGQVWTARAYDAAEKYQAGEVLTVVAIEGVKLICKK